MKEKASSTKGGTKKAKSNPKKATKPLVISRAKVKDLRVSEAEAGRRDASTRANKAGIAVVEPHRPGASSRVAVVEPHVPGAKTRLARVEPHRPSAKKG